MLYESPDHALRDDRLRHASAPPFPVFFSFESKTKAVPSSTSQVATNDRIFDNWPKGKSTRGEADSMVKFPKFLFALGLVGIIDASKSTL